MKAGAQAGLATVEFAVVAAVLLTIIIAAIDISRLFFSVAALNEATRRGVRVAVVCPVSDSAIAQVAVFNATDGGNPLVAGLQPEHVSVQYLDSAGGAVASPGGAGYGSIRYVRVGIEGLQLRTLIPGFSGLIPVPDFAATLPRESLGVLRDGTEVPC